MSKDTSFQIKFEGQEHQIDSNTLINTLIHYNTVINCANKVFSNESKNISIKINAIEKGSFVIDISIIENAFKTLFSSKGVMYTSGLITVVGGVFKAYKFCKGKPVQTQSEQSSIQIEGKSVEINNSIINIYNQPVVREAISKSIETANSDSNVEGINIYSNQIELIGINRDEFTDLIYTNFDTENNISNEISDTVEATLTIVGLSFEKGATWKFIYNGFKISVIVKDDALMNAIEKGERFGKGDAIKVSMRIVKRFNKEYNTYENKSYKIVDFKEHIIKPSQSSLDFNN